MVKLRVWWGDALWWMWRKTEVCPILALPFYVLPFTLGGLVILFPLVLLMQAVRDAVCGCCG